MYNSFDQAAEGLDEGSHVDFFSLKGSRLQGFLENFMFWGGGFTVFWGGVVTVRVERANFFWGGVASFRDGISSPKRASRKPWTEENPFLFVTTSATNIP